MNILFICTFGGDVIKSLVDICDLVEAHLSAVRLWESFSGDDLQEKHQLQPIAEVVFDVLNCRPGFTEVAVTPSGEGLQRKTHKLATHSSAAYKLRQRSVERVQGIQFGS